MQFVCSAAVVLPLGCIRCDQKCLFLRSGSGTPHQSHLAEHLFSSLSALRKLVSLLDNLCVCWWYRDVQLLTTLTIPDVSWTPNPSWNPGQVPTQFVQKVRTETFSLFQCVASTTHLSISAAQNHTGPLSERGP